MSVSVRRVRQKATTRVKSAATDDQDRSRSERTRSQSPPGVEPSYSTTPPPGGGSTPGLSRPGTPEQSIRQSQQSWQGPPQAGSAVSRPWSGSLPEQAQRVMQTPVRAIVSPSKTT